MMVRELIVVLQTMPQDAVVIYDLYSGVDAMREDEVKLVRAEDKKIVKRNDRYETYQQKWVPEKKQYVPCYNDGKFVTVVKFPGN